jgi:prepilin-type N-terminal cleavage/methylation domain-containing protein
MKKNAFTLVELLIVIAIIGVFTTILIGSISSSKAKGRDVQRITDMKQIQIALALYFDNKRTYPQPDMSSLDVLKVDGYIAAIPVDPQTGAPYEYYAPSSRKYCIGVTLEGLVPNDGKTCDSDSGPGNGVSNYKAEK